MATYKIQGRVADDGNSQPLDGVKVQMLAVVTKTDKRGKYALTVDIDEGTVAKLNFSKQGYSSDTITPFRQDGTVILNPKQVRLETTETNLDKEIPRALLPDEETLQALEAINPVDGKQALVKGVLKQVTSIYATLIPAIIGMLAAFGITSLKNLQPTACPNNTKLRQLIAKKNRLVRQLNNIYKTVSAISKTVAGITALITAFRAAIKIILKLPIPQSVPPGIGIPVGITTTFSNTVTKIEKKLDAAQTLSASTLGALVLLQGSLAVALKYLNILDANIQKCVNESGGSINKLPLPSDWEVGKKYRIGDQILYTVQDITGIYICNTDHTSTTTGVTGPPGVGEYWDLLSIVRVNGRDIPQGLTLEGDNLVDASGRVIDENTLGVINGGSGVDSIDLADGGEPISQESLSAELLLIGAATEVQGEPVLQEVNGFIMDVQTDENTPVGSLKRRYAVAKNKQGVILLKGEPSLSSSDQILIDELSFQIQSNDLKPN